MKKRIFALILCVAMVMSLLPTGVFAAEETTETWSVTGIVVANERFYIDTDENGDVLLAYNQATDSYRDIICCPADAGESIIYYEGKNASGDVYADTVTINRALDDDMLGAKVTVNFAGDKFDNNGIVGYKNIEVVGDVILHEDTVAYTVPALDVDIMPNGESTSNSEIRPYISFMVDGVEKKIMMSSDVAKVAKNIDAQTDAAAAEDISCEINNYAYVLSDYDMDADDADLEHPASTAFIAGMGLPTLAQYRFVSVDGGNTYSYMFKLVDDVPGNMATGNAAYGYVSAYNRATGIIRITGVPGLYSTLDLGTEAVVSDGVQVDEPVIVYRENGKIVIEKVDTFNAAVEEFTDYGVMLNGKEYFAWIDCEEVQGYNSLFEYYNEERGAMGAGTTYYTYNNLILEINSDDSAAADASDYAVVLRSYYDSDVDTAYVKLAFADNTEGTYKVGKLYTPKASDLTYEENNLPHELANNTLFGVVVKYKILANGTVDLSAQDFEEIMNGDYDAKTKLVNYGGAGIVNKGKFWGKYGYSDDTVIFALYGNPCMKKGSSSLEIDATGIGYAPVKAKAYKLSSLKNMDAGVMPGLMTGVWADDGNINTIWYASDAIGSYILNTTKNANNYIVAAAVTVGDEIEDANVAYDSDMKMAYVVSATQKYNSATEFYYAEFTLIDEDGIKTAKTVDDVQNDNSCSMLDPDDGVGKLDGKRLDANYNPVADWTGAFIRYEINDDGVITLLDTGDDWGSYVVDNNGVNYYAGRAAQGLYLVNLTGVRNDIVSFYDCYVEEDSGYTLKDIQTSSLVYAEDGCSTIAIDNDNYAGDNLTFISSYTKYLPAADGGNAVIYINEDGELERIFSFAPNYIADGDLASFDEIEEITFGELICNFTSGKVTYYNGEKDIIKIEGAEPVSGVYKISELVIKGDVEQDTSVVCYKDGEACVVEAVSTISGMIEEFTDDDGAVINGKTYYAWPFSEVMAGYSSFFEYCSEERISMNTQYYVYGNWIVDIDVEGAPASIENYAVVLRSYYDVADNTAYVKLAFTDGTEGTYEVGKLYTPRADDLTREQNNLPQELANNTLFGVVVKYEILPDGTVDLSSQDFEEIMAGDADAKTKLIDCGACGIVNKGKFMGKYGYSDDTVIFALYGNPCMMKGANKLEVDATAAGYAPVKAKAYKLSSLKNLDAAVMPGLWTGCWCDDGAITTTMCATDAIGSYVLNTVKSANSYIVAAAITVGDELWDGCAAYDSDAKMAYVVSATQRLNSDTECYYAEFTLISNDGDVFAKTVDDVQNDYSVSMLDPDDGIGKLDGKRLDLNGNPVANWSGRFVRYAINDAGVITMIDTGDDCCSYVVDNDGVDYSAGKACQGLYLVNLTGVRGDIVSFYDLFYEDDGTDGIKNIQTRSLEYAEDGYDIIGINVETDSYAGEVLNFISSRTKYLPAAEGGNAVIYVNEDGEIETIFSFTEGDNSYSTVSYDMNGGEGEIASFTKRAGTNVALSTTVPTREDYIFMGWAESADAAKAEYQPGDIFRGDADTTLYAVWKLECLPGDVNGDETVDFVDAMLVLKHDAGVSELAGDNLLAADANGDGTVDFADAILILKYDAGLIEKLK